MEIRTLRADEIEVKVKQVGEKGAVALLYKTARTDMAVLDEAFGQNNWTNDYKEIKGNLYCGIGIRMADTGEYVWRWDCGIESRADDEGNEKKGEASDAFKRAGTRWGIGRELYTSPFIFLSDETFSAFAEKMVGKVPLKDIYESYNTIRDIFDGEAHDKAERMYAKKLSSPASLGEPGEFTPKKRVEDLTDAEMEDAIARAKRGELKHF